MNQIKKIITLFLGFSISMALQAKQSVIQDQLEQFKNTGVCVGCDLSGATLPSRNHANLAGANLAGASLDIKIFLSSNFSYARMENVRFMGGNASNSKFVNTILTGANLRHTILGNCDFTGANLTNANLAYANLTNSILSKTQLAQALTLHCAIMPDGTKHAPDEYDEC